jgi:hypothetical protein
MVPGEGFEPPTFGLQNRCTATVLTRPSPMLPELPPERQMAVGGGRLARADEANIPGGANEFLTAFGMIV